MTFSELNIIAPILEALEQEGYKNPTPIQQQAIPIALKGGDVLGCAQTGTGKTAAFAIPILQNLYLAHSERQHRTIRCLILTPTRELAIQIGDSFATYGAKLPLKHTVIFGGVGQGPQVDALRRGVEILVATPGRLLDLMSQGYINLQQLSIFVLDEADRMLDMGFVHDVKKVIAKLPPRRQTLFFSATMPSEIQKLADSILSNPTKVEVTPVSSTADTVAQQVYYTDKGSKRQLLAHVLKDSTIGRVLVFTRTKHGADKVVKDLQRIGVSAEAIHGNKSQNARQRALNNFKDGNIRALIATDIAARGIDVDLLSHVINYEIPEVPETYVHRIGRTGRAGASGIAISFCDADERTDFRNIEKLIGKKVPEVANHPYPMEEAGMVHINPPKNKAVVRRPNAIPTANRNNQNSSQSSGQPRNNNRQPRQPDSDRPARPQGGEQPARQRHDKPELRPYAHHHQ
ncbi:MAG: DEAD/DEAH box helicase [Chitinophagia bacterium]|nr:DEAD/DEAH box helicase [Chitinophagia bacterium]